MRYLRSKNNGDIFEWNETLAANPNCEEITEEEAYPERFVPVEQVQRSQQRGKKIDLSSAVEEPPENINHELSRDASRPFRGAAGLRTGPAGRN